MSKDKERQAKKKPCPKCGGSGYYICPMCNARDPQVRRCTYCGGRGVVSCLNCGGNA